MPPRPKTGGNRFAPALVGLMAVALVVYVGVRHLAPRPPEIDVSYSTVSAEGLYQVMFATAAQPVAGGEPQSWVLTVTMPDGTPVADARIAVAGAMPGQGHELPAPQVLENLGEGRYRVGDVRFDRKGHWEMRVSIRAETGADGAVFNIDL